MAVDGLLVVDVDAQYLEPIHEMTEFMDEPWRTRLRGAGKRHQGGRHTADRQKSGKPTHY